MKRLFDGALLILLIFVFIAVVHAQKFELTLPNPAPSITFATITQQGVMTFNQSPKGTFSTGAELRFANINSTSNAASISGYSEPWDRLVAFYVRSYEKNPRDTEEILQDLKISIRFPDGRTVGYSAPKDDGK